MKENPSVINIGNLPQIMAAEECIGKVPEDMRKRYKLE
jgi:hypothetical protein